MIAISARGLPVEEDAPGWDVGCALVLFPNRHVHPLMLPVVTYQRRIRILVQGSSGTQEPSTFRVLTALTSLSRSRLPGRSKTAWLVATQLAFKRKVCDLAQAAPINLAAGEGGRKTTGELRRAMQRNRMTVVPDFPNLGV